MKRYRVPNNKTMAVRLGVEILAILVLVYPMLHIYVFLQGDLAPYKRGFFCDDENIKHPNLEEEISVGICFVIWTCIVLLVVPAVELLHVTVFKQETEQQKRVWGCPWVVFELYRILGYFSLGAMCSLLTTEMAKYKVGRLRPYFLTVCDLELTPEVCKDEYGYDKFVTDYECRGHADEVREASKSFLSGHSSFSFYCATFLIVYLHARLSNLGHDYQIVELGKVRVVFKGLKILRPFMQFGIFSLAFYICLTRISDYKHHPGDVVAGASVGVFFAMILLIFLVDPFNRPRAFKFETYADIEEDCLDGAGEEDGGSMSGVPLETRSSEENGKKNKTKRTSSSASVNSFHGAP